MVDAKIRSEYRPGEVETRWQARWAADGIDRARVDHTRPKHFALTMLPYPSGALHIGHWYAMVPSDMRARFMRMQGFNVLFPMGFDAFGLPAENAAIKNGVHPAQWTYASIDRMRSQLQRMGAMFDWRREMVSSDTEYYRWTQQLFVWLFKAGLAYRKRAAVDWCPGCNTTLAREQVITDDRICERCESPVTRRELEQWFFRTTRYAEELLDFSGLDWPERVQLAQTNWIGRSEGALVRFATDAGESLEVFTTRPDTLWGVTFLAIAPEHPLLPRLLKVDQRDPVMSYVSAALRQSDVQRESTDGVKTGVDTGAFATHPLTGDRVPIWVADYVLARYGTGAVMGVPAHDQRDFDFATRYELKVRQVLQPTDVTDSSKGPKLPWTGRGRMVDSGSLTGTSAADAIGRTIEFLENKGVGHRTVQYRLRDWLVSRQRYWGAPIPVVHCQSCGPVLVPDGELPVTLPEDVEWLPTGESPLKLHPTWRMTQCSRCGGDAERDSDTMDTFVCSSWYHLRYLSPHDDAGPFSKEEYAYWMPVDTYTGGVEHATMHLIYTRFFHKALRDIGLTSGPEPMLQLRNQGPILGADATKMSKSKGNVVAPDDLVDRYGADVVRVYLAWFARWDQGGPWNEKAIEGSARWVRRVWALLATRREHPTEPVASAAARTALKASAHRTLLSVTNDLDRFAFNTVVPSLMQFTSDLIEAQRDGLEGTHEWVEACDMLVLMLAPLMPHIAEELWCRMGKPYSVHLQRWPTVDESAVRAETHLLVVQVNGRVRDRIRVNASLAPDETKAAAAASEVVQRHLNGREPRRVVYVSPVLVNIVS